MRAESAVPHAPAASALFALTLFLLSADRLHFTVDGNKIKLGYFLVAGLWLFAPAAMRDVAAAGLRRPPWPLWLLAVPLAISVATSVEPRGSVLWTMWLLFDLFTVLTVYAFLRTQRLPASAVRQAAGAALGLIALFALAQFVSIYGFRTVVFSPQLHLDTYRINGLSGWPHFLNIFSFLLLPLVLVQEKMSVPVKAIVVALAFVLVQSTAKTGWALFVALGVLLLLLDRPVLVRHYLLFLVPVVVVAMLIPTPSFKADAPMVTGTEKAARFSTDLDLTRPTTSGTDRMLINAMGLQVFLRHPWFGVGPRAYDDYVFRDFDRELPGVNKKDANQQVNAKNENIWIELLAENGLLFTGGALIALAWCLWVPGGRFANRLHRGAWIALVLYFAISGQVSQNAMLTLVYAVMGVYAYARELPGDEVAER